MFKKAVTSLSLVFFLFSPLISYAGDVLNTTIDYSIRGALMGAVIGGVGYAASRNTGMPDKDASDVAVTVGLFMVVGGVYGYVSATRAKSAVEAENNSLLKYTKTYDETTGITEVSYILNVFRYNF